MIHEYDPYCHREIERDEEVLEGDIDERYWEVHGGAEKTNQLLFTAQGGRK